jgi:hypothetical protein
MLPQLREELMQEFLPSQKITYPKSATLLLRVKLGPTHMSQHCQEL